jgi:prepilin-type N-terminal cleavage/methylation domain-containing protein
MQKLLTTSNNKVGFTLLEIMIALAIFAIGIIGMAKLSTFVTAGESFNKQMVNAVTVAHNDIEYILSLAQTSTSLGVGNTFTRPVQNLHGVNYTSEVAISAVGTSASSRRATVSVSWHDKFVPYDIQMVIIR